MKQEEFKWLKKWQKEILIWILHKPIDECIEIATEKYPPPIDEIQTIIHGWVCPFHKLRLSHGESCPKCEKNDTEHPFLPMYKRTLDPEFEKLESITKDDLIKADWVHNDLWEHVRRYKVGLIFGAKEASIASWKKNRHTDRIFRGQYQVRLPGSVERTTKDIAEAKEVIEKYMGGERV